MPSTQNKIIKQRVTKVIIWRKFGSLLEKSAFVSLPGPVVPLPGPVVPLPGPFVSLHNN